MKSRLKYLLVLPVAVFALAGCGSHPHYYGECHVYIGQGSDYRVTVDLYGSSSATSAEGHARLGAACLALRSIDK